MDQRPTEKERFEILMEHMQGQFKLVLEGQTSLRQEVKKDINELRDEFTDMKAIMRCYGKDIGELKSNVVELKSDMSVVKISLNRIELNQTDHNNRISKLEKAQ